MKPKVVAVSASLRNARWGRGTQDLVDQIRRIENEADLFRFVTEQGRVHYQQFIDSGRAEGLPFDELYKNLRRKFGGSGLCNSEIGMTAGLWGALSKGCDIDYIPLSSYFGPTGQGKDLGELKHRLMEADGVLLCTPVYFGDRSSLASDFIEFVRRDTELRDFMEGKPFAGIVVGAKRNGGQETTLVYQMMEMTSLGMLGLGNDSDTTAQYGGTIVAGDVGEACGDEYGLRTAIGAGKRLGRIVMECSLAENGRLADSLKTMFWILQDVPDGIARKLVDDLIREAGDGISARVLELQDSSVGRCIACDICPVQVGPDADYRCIIRTKRDPFPDMHESFLDNDLIVPVVYSPRDRSQIRTMYQRFIERTRYLRRGDYLFTDVSVMPLVVEELGAGENMHIRLATSLVRHHTVMLKPNIAYLQSGKLLNKDEVLSNWHRARKQARQITIGRLSALSRQPDVVSYNPVGYILSAARDKELSVQERRRLLQEDRSVRQKRDVYERLITE